MVRSGDHRIRHLARWVATPTLVLAAAAVLFAAYEGSVSLLTGAAFGALAAGVLAVTVFDIELLRSRRHHGADRVAQARAYAAMYAAHVRVMAEGFALSDSRRTPVPDARGRAVPTDDPLFGKTASAGRAPIDGPVDGPADGVVDGPVDRMPADLPPPDVAATAVPTDAGRAGDAQVAAIAARKAAQRPAVEEVLPAAEIAEPTDAPASTDVDAAPATAETASVDRPVPATAPAATAFPSSADADDAPAETWNDFLDAPTVVDLMAWEIRARLAAEEERERLDAEAAAAEAADEQAAAEAAGGAAKPVVRSKSSRGRRNRRRKGA
jgi:hypothetical protein